MGHNYRGHNYTVLVRLDGWLTRQRDQTARGRRTARASDGDRADAFFAELVDRRQRCYGMVPLRREH